MNLIPPQIDVDLDELRLPEGYEWVDGQAVEKPMGCEASVVTLALTSELVPFVRTNKLGFVGDAETGYQLPNLKKKQLRKPDASFVARGRFPDEKPPRGDAKLAPDLAVETISPNDVSEDTDVRISEYMQAGTSLVWVIYPKTRAVHVFRSDGTAA